MSRDDARRLAFRAVGSAVAAVLVALGVLAARIDYATVRDHELAEVSGWAAVVFLFAALLVTPVRRLLDLAGRPLPKSEAVAFRRAFGIASAVLATAHAAIATFTWLGGSWRVVLERPHLRLGALALIVLLVLAATSFDRVIRGLRIKLWTELHRLAYVAAALVALHLMQSAFASRTLVLAAFSALVVVGLARALPHARRRERERAAPSDSEP